MSEKEQLALRTVKNYMWWSGGAGLIPVPILDVAAVSGVQLRMLAAVSKIYDVPFHDVRGKAIIASLSGSLIPQTMSFGLIWSALKSIPVVGSLAGAPAMVAFSAASAWALGKVFITHFELGGTFLDFDPDRVREYFRTQFEEGRRMTNRGNTEAPA